MKKVLLKFFCLDFVYKFVFLKFPEAQQFTLGNLVQII